MRERKGHVPWVLSAQEGTVPAQGAPPVRLTSPTLRFCGLIQALVTNPDSTTPAEETEGVGEVLEVRKGAWERREWGWGRAGGLTEPPSRPPPAV